MSDTKRFQNLLARGGWRPPSRPKTSRPGRPNRFQGPLAPEASAI